MNKRGDEYYTKLAKKEWYLARSAYKLKEIDEKYKILSWADSFIDIGCAPGSRLQYVSKTLQIKGTWSQQIIWIDLKKVWITLPWVFTYEQDVADREWIKEIFDSHDLKKVDVILSDMAPDTIWMADIDAIRSIGLIEKTFWVYETYLKEWGKFAIKVFMWPGYQELVIDLKNRYWATNIVTLKPKSCRKQSKEIFVIKRS